MVTVSHTWFDDRPTMLMCGAAVVTSMAPGWIELNDVETGGLILMAVTFVLVFLVMSLGVAIMWRRFMDPRRRKRSIE